ncbi:MAG: hypothetical protein FWH57_04690 [Oscillospiraceae bacterium]|nr:hypothetical protein [Oscillospiraceae bacterium]
MLILNSAKYQDILYEPGEKIDYLPKETGIPFIFEVSDDLTNDINAMNQVALFLDDIDSFREKALKYISLASRNTTDLYHDEICSFLEMKRDNGYLPGIDSIKDFSLEEMVEHLWIVRFISYKVDKSQVFVLYLGFGPDSSLFDEVLIVFFNTNKEVFLISYEN